MLRKPNTQPRSHSALNTAHHQSLCTVERFDGSRDEGLLKLFLLWLRVDWRAVWRQEVVELCVIQWPFSRTFWRMSELKGTRWKRDENMMFLCELTVKLRHSVVSVENVDVLIFWLNSFFCLCLFREFSQRATSTWRKPSSPTEGEFNNLSVPLHQLEHLQLSFFTFLYSLTSFSVLPVC